MSFILLYHIHTLAPITVALSLELLFKSDEPLQARSRIDIGSCILAARGGSEYLHHLAHDQ